MAKIIRKGVSFEQPPFPVGEKFTCQTCKATIETERDDMLLYDPTLIPVQDIIPTREQARKPDRLAWQMKCPRSDETYEHTILLLKG